MMKKTILLAVLALFLGSMVINAQVKKNQIKTSLFFVLVETFQLSYERVLNDEMSLNLELSIGQVNSVLPSFRYYLTEKPAPDGAYIAPHIQLRDDGGSTDFGGGVMVGYQRLFKQKISLEAFLGPQLTTNGVGAWGGINLGLAF